MKFKTSIGDGAFFGLVIYCVLTLAMYIFWVVSAIWWPAIVLTAVLFVVILPIYFGTNYVLGRDSLTISCGIAQRNIPYRNIISVTDANCFTPAFALSHKRICLRYLEGDDIKSTYISPTSRDGFRDALNKSMQNALASLKSRGDTTNIEVIEEVEAVKERLAREHELTRAEERAIADKEDETKELMRENLAKEIKKLDDIIDGNIDPSSVVLSQAQEDYIASRRAVERKLYARVLKLKRKKDKADARNALREERRLEQERAMSSANVVFSKPEKVKAPKKTADEKFADKERAKADKFNAQQEHKKQKIEKKALAEAQREFEQAAVFVEKKEKKQKPEIEKVKATNQSKINTAKRKKGAKSAVVEEPSAESRTKEQKKKDKEFKREVKVEAKKLKKEALAEAKAEKKSAAEKLAKEAGKASKKSKK